MFESVCIAGLLHDPDFLKRSIAYIKPEYFQNDSQKFIFNQIVEFVNKYNATPTIEALGIIAQNTKMPDSVFEGVLEVLEDAKTPAGNDTDWMTDEAEKWAQERALYIGIMESIGIMDGSNKSKEKNSIPEILSQALAVSFDSHIGHEYFDEAENRFDYYHADTTKFPFGIDMLNKVTKGGVPKKTLNVYLAPINGGKSVFLVDQAAHWLLQGKDVVFFTMEMSEETVAERIDVRVMDLTFDMLMLLDKGQYLGKIQQIRKATMGRLIIKEFPTSGASVAHFRHALGEMRTKKGFRPDLMVVDYLTIMASSKLPSSAKGNTNTYYTSVAEELRALAKEMECPVWTAAQYTRDGQAKSSVSMADVGAAIGICATADFMLAGHQPEELIPLNQIMIDVMKNRYNNKSKYRNFILGYNVEKQKYSDVSDAQQAHVNRAAEPQIDLETGEITAGSLFGEIKF